MGVWDGEKLKHTAGGKSFKVNLSTTGCWREEETREKKKSKNWGESRTKKGDKKCIKLKKKVKKKGEMLRVKKESVGHRKQ